jgi:hypothetical protein
VRPPCIHPIYIHTLAFNAAKSQLTKANQTKIKMENLARELQKVRHVVSPNLTTLTVRYKDNKRLRVSECYERHATV